MTQDDMIFLDRINEYANLVMEDIDPQKVRISTQLDKLRPIMEEIATEQKKPLEDIFIRYMDLASDQGVNQEKKFQDSIQNPSDFVDFK
jgi:hypothetical protein